MHEDASLHGYVCAMASRLGLTDWEFEVEHDADLPSDTLARVHIPTGRQVATIRLGSAYKGCTDRDKRATIVHELLHCHFDPVTDLAHRVLPDALGDSAWNVYEEAQDLLVEKAIDPVSVAVAEFLPLPPEGSN